ncbi:MAG: DNA cytosine methyltransferase [Alphaproteobacteria bacterium]
MRHVDLCSGIGGFALGFQWAGLSSPVLFCDIDEWARKVLHKHWPNVPIAVDVKELAIDPKRFIPECDIITAGYPCQPFSIAGGRRGSEDDRHIWPEIFTIVKGRRPSWCVFENVYGHLTLGLDEVLTNLESAGYAARPFIVPACAVDARHRRDRIWIIARNMADTDNARQSTGSGSRKNDRDGQRNNSRGSGQNVADTKGKRVQGHRPSGKQEPYAHEGKAISLCGSERPRAAAWDVEPNVGRVATGIPKRVDRIKGLGNSIVPQIAMQIGRTIKEVNYGTA